MKLMLSFFIAQVLLVSTAFSQEEKKEEFKPSGKPFATVHANFNSGLTESTPSSGFDITRAYLGYGYALSERWSGKVTLDVADPKSGDFQYVGLLRLAALTYKTKKLTADMGMINTTQFATQDKVWGRRYIYKSFQDEYKYNSSGDIGVSVAYKLHKAIQIDGILTNGEGYKKAQANRIYRGGIGVTGNITEELMVRAFSDVVQRVETQLSVAFLAAYVTDKFSVGAEYNMQQNVKNKADKDMKGVSVYGGYKITDKKGLFARYDMHDSYDALASQSVAILGYECSPVKGLKASLNARVVLPKDNTLDEQGYGFVNLEYAF